MSHDYSTLLQFEDLVTSNFADAKFSLPRLAIIAFSIAETPITLRLSNPNAGKAVCLLPTTTSLRSDVSGVGFEPTTSAL